MKSFFSNSRKMFFLGLALFAVSLSAIYWLSETDESPGKTWPYNQSGAEEVSLSAAWSFVDLTIEEGEVPGRIGVLDDYIYVETADTTVRAKIPYPSTLLISDFVRYSSGDLRIYENTSYKVTWSDRLFQILPIILILGILGFILFRGAAKSLGLDAAFEIVDTSKLEFGFESVAGIDNAKADLQEVIEFIKAPERFHKLGARVPKGALFVGPPGVGKTMIARAMAKEAGVPFIKIDATSVTQIFVGAGSMKIKSAFRAARRLKKCIIFIDEIDAMGRARGAGGQSGGSDEKESTLNALLVELDGFDKAEGIFVIAATNRPEILDPALTRPGRIDRRVEVTLPDVIGREAILEAQWKKVPRDADVDAARVARTTYGFSGADLASVINEAALAAARRNVTTVSFEDFEVGRDRVMMGQTSSDRLPTPSERELIAKHEAGHAFVAHTRKHADPIAKATIIPRGGALGHVMQMPDSDHLIQTRDRLIAQIEVAVAGRVAEILFMGDGSMTTGAQSDIEVATRIARGMVEKWGMSAKGFIAISGTHDALHDGEPSTGSEVKRIIDAAIANVTKDMKRAKPKVEELARQLMLRETLFASDIAEILDEKTKKEV